MMRSTFVFRRALRAGEEPHNPGNLELAIIVKFWGAFCWELSNLGHNSFEYYICFLFVQQSVRYRIF